MAVRQVSSTILHPNGTAWAGGVVRFRLKPDTFRSTPPETYPEDVVLAVADASGDIGVTLISGTGVLYEVTLPSGDQFTIAVPDGTATTLEALRASFSGAPVSVDSVEDALIALYGSAPIGRPPLAVQEGDTTIVAEAATIDFDAAHFNVTESPTGEANVALANPTSSLDTLTDVAITGAPADDGEVLQSDGTNFVNVRPAPMLLIYVPPPSAVVWTNMPAAVTFFNGNGYYYYRVDAANLRQARLWADLDVAGAGGADLLFQYSTDFSVWTTIVSVLIDTTGGRESAWTDLPAGAKTVAYFRLAGQDGNAVADPSFRNVTVQMR